MKTNQAAKHTPGPWVAIPRGFVDGDGVDAKDGPVVRRGLCPADARLIAAAPELLEAAKLMLEGMDDFLHVDAIAKAEGRGSRH